MRIRTCITAALMAGAAASPLTACDNSSDGSTTSTDPRPASLKGKPVRFMAIVDVTTTAGVPTMLPTFKATVAAVNASGGIGGRPLEMTVCDSAMNPNTTASCARKAVAAKVPAVVSYTANGGTFESILARARIPDVGNPLVVPLQLTSPNSFPVTAGAPGVTAGYVPAAKRADCDKIAYVASAPAAYAAAHKATFEGFKKNAAAHGMRTGEMIQAPPGAPDFTPYLATAQQEDASCIVLQPLPSDVVAMVAAARKLNVTAKLIMANALLDPTSVKSLGSRLDGVWAVDATWPPTAAEGHPGVEQFVSDMNRFASDRKLTTADQLPWTGIRLFASVADGLKKVDAQSVTTALNRLRDYESGVTPPISFDRPAPDGAPAPRMFQPSVVVGTYEGSEVKPHGFFNIATAAAVPFE